tara:strand:- start:3357 stop:3467 length:111 start_codon:yes stop_codon:yes gene_type:complete
MPTVNGKKYSYTKEGRDKAAAAKLRSKKKIVRRKKK